MTRRPVHRMLAFAGAAALTLSLAACSSDDADGDDREPGGHRGQRRGGAATEFPAGSTMAELAEAGKITIGTKFDQPGFGLLNPARTSRRASTSRSPRSSPASWAFPRRTRSPGRRRSRTTASRSSRTATSTSSSRRTRSTTSARKSVDFAGPYYQAGQDLMVAIDNTLDIRARTTSPARRSAPSRARPPRRTSRETTRTPSSSLFDVYSKCVEALKNGQVDASPPTTSSCSASSRRTRSVRAGRQPVHRGALRHRPQEGRRRVPRRSSTTCSRTAFDDGAGPRPGRRPPGSSPRRPSRRRSTATDASARPAPMISAALTSERALPSSAAPARTRRRAGDAHMDAITENLDLYWAGFLTTVSLSLLAGLVAFSLGTLLAAFRVSPIPPLRGLGTFYVEVVRNTPLTVVWFFMVFATAADRHQRCRRSSCSACSRWASTPRRSSARRCDRASTRSSAGQAEAARAIGLTFTQTLGLVVLPQAFRTVVPPLGNVWIAMVKNSSIGAAFAITELTAVATQLVNLYPADVVADLRRCRLSATSSSPSRPACCSASSSDGWWCSVSQPTVLYDVLGPKGRRNVRIGTALGTRGRRRNRRRGTGAALAQRTARGRPLGGAGRPGERRAAAPWEAPGQHAARRGCRHGASRWSSAPSSPPDGSATTPWCGRRSASSSSSSAASRCSC